MQNTTFLSLFLGFSEPFFAYLIDLLASGIIISSVIIYKMRIRFWIRKNKTNKAGQAPLYCYITINGVRSGDFSVNLIVPVIDWNAKTQKLKGKLANQYNHELDLIRMKIMELKQKCQTENITVTSALLKKLYLGQTSLEFTFLEMFDQFINRQSLLVNISISPATLEVYQVRRNNLAEFLESKKSTKILPSQFNTGYAENFFLFMRTEKRCKQNYTIKNLQTFKQVLYYCVRQGIITHNPLQAYRFKFEKDKPIISITEEERFILENKKFPVKRLQHVADLFLMQCYTGMSYAELRRFTKDHIKIGVDKKKWIFISRQKVEGSICTIPIIPQAKLMLEKYEYQLPKISNQKYNGYLKEVADLCGIEKNLTTHCGRKTCGMLMLDMGFSIEVVSKVLGHSNTKTTERRYAKISEKRIADEFGRLYGN